MQELPHSVLEESRRQWKYKAIFVRSLGHRVPADWMAWEFKLKPKLNFDDKLEVFPLVIDYMILEGDCALARAEGPCFVAGQLLAMEPW